MDLQQEQLARSMGEGHRVIHGLAGSGKTTILRMNYRNTAQIMAVACKFARDLLSAKEAEEDAIPLVAPQSAGRSGSLPELRSSCTAARAWSSRSSSCRAWMRCLRPARRSPPRRSSCMSP
jgi:hypothetical protein